MSEIKVNKISPKQTCTQLTLGDSGDTIIIPAGATIQNSGTATGFSRNGVVNWDTTAKTTGFTAVSGVGYFCDTTSSAFTVTLPATPTAGDVVGIADYANTFATNNLTVGRNSSKIGGVSANAVLYTSGVSITFVYVDATQGWILIDSGNRSDLTTPQYVAATGGTIATCGNYKIHSFTGPGTFTVTNAGNPIGSNTVDYLVVAGGGGGTNTNACVGKGGAGGGAGGVRFYASPDITSYPASPRNGPAALPVSATSYPITVGSGGTKGSPACSSVTNGNDSIFSTITSAGGGKAGTNANRGGGPGGSGGGASRDGGPAGTAGTGNTPPVSPPQGMNGGSQTAPGGNASAGGGGGFMVVGSSDTRPFPQPGDSAQPGGTGGGFPTGFVSTTGSPSGGYQYFGGGGGGGNITGPGGGTGGTGGGGPGGWNGNNATDGTANTGGGGGGTYGAFQAGAGGSGIVVIRYKFQ